MLKSNGQLSGVLGALWWGGEFLRTEREEGEPEARVLAEVGQSFQLLCKQGRRCQGSEVISAM